MILVLQSVQIRSATVTWAELVRLRIAIPHDTAIIVYAHNTRLLDPEHARPLPNMTFNVPLMCCWLSVADRFHTDNLDMMTLRDQLQVRARLQKRLTCPPLYKMPPSMDRAYHAMKRAEDVYATLRCAAICLRRGVPREIWDIIRAFLFRW